MTSIGPSWVTPFPSASAFKPYPHCRVTRGVLHALIELVKEHNIEPDEIDSLTAWGEGWAEQMPSFMNRDIEQPFDAQFSFPHVLALAAHGVPPGRDWQDPELVYAASVARLMDKVVWRSHPDWADAVARDPAARPSRVEISARGKTFVESRDYAKGSPSHDPSSYMTTSELIEKFERNAADVLPASDTERLIELVLSLEAVTDIGSITALLRPGIDS